MSVLIRGAEMPEKCSECSFCVNGFTDEAPVWECACESTNGSSVLVDYHVKPFDFRPDWCSLVEVPTPHGRLIDADALKTKIEIFNIGCGCSEDYQKSFLDAIDEQPTIIEGEGSEG